MRKNYTKYKDGLPVMDLTECQLEKIRKKICIRVRVKINDDWFKIRVRQKPFKKLTVLQENKILKRKLWLLTNELKKGE